MSGQQPGHAAEDPAVFQPLAADDPTTVAGYRLAARLGAGGMGKVYLSYTPGGRAVAIKVIRPEFGEDAEFRRRFALEVRAAQRVQGLFTAPVIDADAEGTRPWLATAYVPGPSLADAVVAHGALPVETVLLLVAGMAEALQVIHGAGLVHRDLKPSNVLLASDGPRVIDFGIAHAADATSLTGSGVTIGTPAFMAPEQAAGSRVTPATDVFALGQVAAYAASGLPAFGEGTGHGILYRIVHEQPDLSTVPERLTELVSRCLAKDPADRPSVAEVIRLCQAANAATVLRRPEDWLPSAVSAEITARVAIPAPVQAPPPPISAPTIAPAASVAPAAPPTAPASPVAPATPPATAPAGHAPTAAPGPSGPAVPPAPPHPQHPYAPTQGVGGGYPTVVPQPGPYQNPTPNPGLHQGPNQGPNQGLNPHPTGYPGGAPTGYPSGYPTSPTGYPTPFPQAPGQPPTGGRKPGNGSGSGRRTLLVGLAAALVFGVGGATAAYVATKDDGTGNAASKDNTPGDRTGSGGTASGNGSGGSGTGGTASSAKPSVKPAAAPRAYRSINLPAGYHLTLSDTGMRPQDGEDGGYDLSYDTGGYLDAESTGGHLVLLDPSQEGSLAVCRADTRFTGQVYLDKLSPGRQLCVITGSGHMGMVTVRGFSAESSPSTYMTLDVTVWPGGAV
ncbi:protein kinase [Streptomyces sp. NPDC090025]|uniref:serine/threonine-protein kinase n=1 Tax=Streptomyces sp. NPDC090025 TaxID=3365922 RepID=UPI0038387C75